MFSSMKSLMSRASLSMPSVARLWWENSIVSMSMRPAPGTVPESPL